jgi:hypothetical protein
MGDRPPPWRLAILIVGPVAHARPPADPRPLDVRDASRSVRRRDVGRLSAGGAPAVGYPPSQRRSRRAGDATMPTSSAVSWTDTAMAATATGSHTAPAAQIARRSTFVSSGSLAPADRLAPSARSSCSSHHSNPPGAHGDHALVQAEEVGALAYRATMRPNGSVEVVRLRRRRGCNRWRARQVAR